MQRMSRNEIRPAVIKDGYALLPLGAYGRLGSALIDVKFVYLEKYNWYINPGGYVYTKSINGKNIRLHRIVLPNDDTSLVIDHINRDKLDNRLCNLRLVSVAANAHNMKLYTTNTSGISGVHWAKHAKKWCVTIKHNYKRHYLGYFDNLEDAAEVRRQGELKYWGVINTPITGLIDSSN